MAYNSDAVKDTASKHTELIRGRVDQTAEGQSLKSSLWVGC